MYMYGSSYECRELLSLSCGVMSARLFALQCKLGAVDEQLGNFEQVSLSAYYHVLY